MPVIALAIISVRTSVNIPFEDDYAIGFFLGYWIKAPTVFDKLKLFITWQHVQYKLFFMYAAGLIQYYLIGATNYRTLQLLGDAGLLGVPVVLWFLLARSGRPLTQRIWLFVFPCFLFLSPCYVETINWALSGLQNIFIFPFALATIFFVTSTGRRSFAWSTTFLVLSIATSGNGFFVVFVSIYLLLRSRRFNEALATFAVTTLMAIVYAYHYRVYMVDPYAPTLRLSIERKILFPFVFLGGAAHSRNLAFVIGLLLVVGFVLLTRKGWERACPGSFGAALFCFITTAGVTFTRSNAGLPGAVSERYMTYGLLLVCLEYIAVLRLYGPKRFAAHSRWIVAVGALSVVAIVICAVSDVRAYRQLEARRNRLITHLILWERHPDRLVLVPDEDPEKQTAHWVFMRKFLQGVLAEDVALGIYHPPFSAKDPLPVRTHSPATMEIENECDSTTVRCF